MEHFGDFVSLFLVSPKTKWVLRLSYYNGSLAKEVSLLLRENENGSGGGAGPRKGLAESRLFPIMPEAHESRIVRNGLRRMFQSNLPHNELLACTECLAPNSS